MEFHEQSDAFQAVPVACDNLTWDSCSSLRLPGCSVLEYSRNAVELQELGEPDRGSELSAPSCNLEDLQKHCACAHMVVPVHTAVAVQSLQKSEHGAWHEHVAVDGVRCFEGNSDSIADRSAVEWKEIRRRRTLKSRRPTRTSESHAGVIYVGASPWLSYDRNFFTVSLDHTNTIEAIHLFKQPSCAHRYGLLPV